MNKDANNKPNRNRFIVPVICISLLIVFSFSFSYAYLTTESAMNTTEHHINLPQKCNLTVQNNVAGYDYGTISASAMASNSNLTFNYNSTANILLNGSAGCSCNYNLVLTSVGDAFYSTNPTLRSDFDFSFYGNVNGAGGNNSVSHTVGNPLTDSYDNVTEITNSSDSYWAGFGKIEVTTTGTQVKHTWNLNSVFHTWNDINQINHQGKIYSYKIGFYVNGCTFADDSITLPNTMTRVDWVQNVPGAYIDTGYIPNFNKNIHIEIESTPTALGKRYCLMSNYNGSNHLSLEIYNDNKGRIYYNGNPDIKLGEYSTSGNNYYIMDYNHTDKTYTLNINGTVISGTMNGSGVSAATMRLYVDQADRFSTFNTPIKIRRVRISENGVPVRDMIPIMTMVSTMGGFYDLVNGKAYYNNGTGNLVAGND